MTNVCDAYETTRDLPHFCKDCTDCVIKQVIEKCKRETNIDVNNRGDLAERILSSFHIEEINK
jgi:hypothetical protein